MIKLTTKQIRQLAEFSGLFTSVDPELQNKTYYINETTTGGVMVWSEDAPETEVATLEE